MIENGFLGNKELTPNLGTTLVSKVNKKHFSIDLNFKKKYENIIDVNMLHKV